MTVIEASVSLFLIAVIAVLVWTCQQTQNAARARRKSARATLLGLLEAY